MRSDESIHPSIYFAAVSLISVFMVDMETPTRFSVDILYLCCILIVFKRSATTIIGFAVAAGVLITVSALLSDTEHGAMAFICVNKGIAICAIAVTTYMVAHYRRLDDRSKLKEQRHITSMEKMLFMISHEVRRPVANIIGLIDTLHNDLPANTHPDIQEYYRYLRASAVELDRLMRQLNEFVEKSDEQ